MTNALIGDLKRKITGVDALQESSPRKIEVDVDALIQLLDAYDDSFGCDRCPWCDECPRGAQRGLYCRIFVGRKLGIDYDKL
jgi:hypothetical protein